MKRFLVVEIRENEICVHGCVWARNKNCAGFNFAEGAGWNADIRVLELKEDGQTIWEKPFGGGELATEQAQVPVTLGSRAGNSHSISVIEVNTRPRNRRP
jgi:hypothetical protein